MSTASTSEETGNSNVKTEMRSAMEAQRPLDTQWGMQPALVEEVALMCHSHGYLPYLEPKNICIHHGNDKGEIIQECISQDSLNCKSRNPILKCLTHFTDKSGGESGIAGSII